MAIDLIVRAADRIATLVHDDPACEIDGIAVMSGILFLHSKRGMIPISEISPALLSELSFCNKCIVVLMSGFEVVSTKEARIIS